jgi:anti-anti-sigma factor
MGGLGQDFDSAIGLEATHRTIADDHIIALRGEFDLAGAQTFAAAMGGVNGSSVRVVFDLSELSFMDVAGLRAIEGARTGLRARGIDVVVCRPQRAVRRVLALCERESWLAEGTGSGSDASMALRSGAGTHASLVTVSMLVDGDDAEGESGASAALGAARGV